MRNRGRLPLKAIVAPALIGLVAFVVAAGTLVWSRAAAFNEAVSFRDSSVSSVLWGELGHDRVNVALLGYSDESRDGAYLSDSINILSIADDGTTTLVAIPRDLWVEGLPEVPENMKINEAFRIGYYAAGLQNAGDLASEAIEYVTGLDIDGWISLDFQGFAAMVDAVDGVTIENPRDFWYTWDEAEFPQGIFPFHFPAGTLKLNGEEALDYSRVRFASVPEEASDFGRSVRQQRVLAALRDKIDGPSAIGDGLRIADALEGHLHTNLSVLDLFMLSSHLRPDARVELTEGEVVEATTNTIGQYVLVVIDRASPTDYGPLQRYLRARLG